MRKNLAETARQLELAQIIRRIKLSNNCLENLQGAGGLVLKVGPTSHNGLQSYLDGLDGTTLGTGQCIVFNEIFFV